MSVPFSVSCASWQAARLWGELTECYHGKNGFGGHTVEIYAYTLRPSDLYTMCPDMALAAARDLVSICYAFSEHCERAVTIDGLLPGAWLDEMGRSFTHRVHVHVSP